MLFLVSSPADHVYDTISALQGYRPSRFPWLSGCIPTLAFVLVEAKVSFRRRTCTVGTVLTFLFEFNDKILRLDIFLASTSTRLVFHGNVSHDMFFLLPVQLMNLMEFADQQNKEECCVSWLPDGKSFIIRNPDEFTRQLVPKYFKATKFSSFTRKLYRWGFRQVNRGIGPDDPIIFGNEHFQRDNAELMSKMRSVTAAGTRKQDDTHGMFSMKRSMEDSLDDGHHKRMLLDHLMSQQKASMMSQNPSLYGAMNTNGSMSLSNALRPSMGMGQMNQGTNHNMMGMNGNSRSNMQPYDLMANQSQMHNGNGMNNYMPQGNNNGNSQYPNASSTTEIVNAAIAALRYA
jgi:hypothetical protein